MSEYSEKLLDGRWQKKRLEIFQRAGWQCEECWTSKNLQVHHVFYITGNEPWDYPEELLMCVCGSCHLKRQKIEQQIFKNVGAVIRWKSLEELREQPIWTFFNNDGPIITTFQE